MADRPTAGLFNRLHSSTRVGSPTIVRLVLCDGPLDELNFNVYRVVVA